MRVLFDTNVVLDALLDRDPWAEVAVFLFAKVESGELVGHLGATTLTTVYYTATRTGVRMRRTRWCGISSGSSRWRR